MEISWSLAAERDLARIYKFLEAAGYHVARRVIRRLFEAIDRLSELPRSGSTADLGTKHEYRQLVVDHYKIFYRRCDSELIIVRLWDTRRNPSDFFIP